MRRKLLTLSRTKAQTKAVADVIVEGANHSSRRATHTKLEAVRSWVRHAAVLLPRAVLTFVSTLEESTAGVICRCDQMTDATTASDHLLGRNYPKVSLVQRSQD